VSDRFTAWIDAYEKAWRTAGTGALTRLFTEDASYRPGPFELTAAGLEAIAEFWEAERDGPDEMFTLSSELVAAQGDIGVARVEVVYAASRQRTYRDLWVITLASDGRCRAFEEWPFHPEQALTPPEDTPYDGELVDFIALRRERGAHERARRARRGRVDVRPRGDAAIERRSHHPGSGVDASRRRGNRGDGRAQNAVARPGCVACRNGQGDAPLDRLWEIGYVT